MCERLQQRYVGETFAGFPAGDRLDGYAYAFGQLLLCQAALAAERGDKLSGFYEVQSPHLHDRIVHGAHLFVTLWSVELKQIVLVNLGLLRLVSDSGEDISVEYVVADVVHEALACVLSVLAAIVVAVWQFV